MDYPQRLKTPRLLLNRIDANDRNDFIAVHGDPRATRALGAMPAHSPANLFDRHIEHWARRGYGWWSVRNPHTGRLLGYGGLHAEALDDAEGIAFGYAFLPDVSEFEQAYALVRVAVAQGFVRLGVQDIIRLVAGDDAVSRRVAEKAGFRPDGQVLRAQRAHTRYRLSARAWCALPSARETPLRAAALQTA